MPLPPATADTDRAQSGPGRPRLVGPKRSGPTARDEILDAAAELFTTLGYTATSTRRIADAVGIRQASLYHYFATKDDILAALLDTTVAGSLDHARRLSAHDAPAADRLLELARLDTGQLAASRWNLGALYLLPEVSAARFDGFRRARGELAAVYAELAGQAVGDAGDPRTAIPFRLVESVIMVRADEARGEAGAHGAAALIDTIVDAIARIL